MSNLRAPFPYFGGKRRIASLVWERFGDVPNYVEPFFGSGAVLLGRPHAPRVETVNDLDDYIANFWRAVVADPVELARHADWPVNETDLHARHRWLVDQHAGLHARMLADKSYFDVEIAGLWVWGISQWIGSGWCMRPDWSWRVARGAPGGVHRKRPDLSGRHGAANGRGVHAKRPRIASGGRGVTREVLDGKLPAIGAGRGLGLGISRQIPRLSGSQGEAALGVREGLVNWMLALQERLRYVRVCCGDWSRVLGPSPTTAIGVTGVFLDPPYDPQAIANGSGASDAIYAHHGASVSADVRAWAIEHGDDPLLRIALCGYEGEHDELEAAGWDVVSWKSHGGYGVRVDGQGKRNSHRERVWFSPHCLSAHGPLFEESLTAAGAAV